MPKQKRNGSRLRGRDEELYILLLPFGGWSISWAKLVAPEGFGRGETCRPEENRGT